MRISIDHLRAGGAVVPTPLSERTPPSEDQILIDQQKDTTSRFRSYSQNSTNAELIKVAAELKSLSFLP